jgi:hypothetical protein
MLYSKPKSVLLRDALAHYICLIAGIICVRTEPVREKQQEQYDEEKNCAINTS